MPIPPRPALAVDAITFRKPCSFVNLKPLLTDQKSQLRDTLFLCQSLNTCDIDKNIRYYARASNQYIYHLNDLIIFQACIQVQYDELQDYHISPFHALRKFVWVRFMRVAVMATWTRPAPFLFGFQFSWMTPKFWGVFLAQWKEGVFFWVSRAVKMGTTMCIYNIFIFINMHIYIYTFKFIYSAYAYI